MRANLRWTMIWLAGGFVLAPAPAALAQSTTSAPPSTQPTSNAIGPSELQNFSLPGSVTKPADQQPAASAPAAPPPAAAADRAGAVSAPARGSVESRPISQQVAQRDAVPAVKPGPLLQSAPSSSAAAPPPLETNPVPAPAPTAQPAFPSAAAPAEPAGTLAPEHNFSMLPWLLTAFVLVAATLFLLWLRRPREALAAGPQFDLFVPPEPLPAPAPMPRAPPPKAAAPQPDPTPKPTAPAPKGIVSTRLRPTVEISVQPLRCVVDDERVVIECELELFNSGAAPARALIAEASLFNAGATQDHDLAAFFAHPVGAGERLDALPPMQRVTFTSQVVAPRAAMQEYELAGRKALVPVLAFNALYEWSGKQAQTSAAYLVGRETNGDKLGPLGLKDGAHEFRKLGARVLPAAVRS